MTRLRKDEALLPGQGILSSNRKYNFEMQIDGNLALYLKNVLIWSTNTENGVRFVMESSGSAVLYDKNDQVLFSTRTENIGEYFEVLENGDMAVFNQNNKQIWSSNTYRGDYFV